MFCPEDGRQPRPGLHTPGSSLSRGFSGSFYYTIDRIHPIRGPPSPAPSLVAAPPSQAQPAGWC